MLKRLFRRGKSFSRVNSPVIRNEMLCLRVFACCLNVFRSCAMDKNAPICQAMHVANRHFRIPMSSRKSRKVWPRYSQGILGNAIIFENVEISYFPATDWTDKPRSIVSALKIRGSGVYLQLFQLIVEHIDDLTTRLFL